MSRVFVLDPGLRRRNGHNYQMAAGILRGVRERDLECVVVSHEDADADMRAELSLQPLFSLSHYDLVSRDKYSGVLEDFIVGARSVTKELSRLKGPPIATDDLVILPTAGPREIHGLAAYLLKSKARPYVAALYHRTEPPGTSLAAGSVTAAATRFSARKLQNAIGETRLKIAATNAWLAKKLSPALGWHVEVLPAPVWYPPPCPPRQNDGNTPVVTFLGHMKRNHGFELIPSLAREIRRRWPAARIRIHLGAVGPGLDILPYRELATDGVAEIVEGWLDDAAMAAMYCNATVMVMPYDAGDYREMVSAVMSTAIALGKPCVVPARCWLSEQIASGNASGEVFESDGIDDIASAIERVMANYAKYAERATKLARAWRQSQSGDSLVTHVLDWYRNGLGT